MAVRAAAAAEGPDALPDRLTIRAKDPEAAFTQARAQYPNVAEWRVERQELWGVGKHGLLYEIELSRPPTGRAAKDLFEAAPRQSVRVPLTKPSDIILGPGRRVNPKLDEVYAPRPLRSHPYTDDEVKTELQLIASSGLLFSSRRYEPVELFTLELPKDVILSKEVMADILPESAAARREGSKIPEVFVSTYNELGSEMVSSWVSSRRTFGEDAYDHAKLWLNFARLLHDGCVRCGLREESGHVFNASIFHATIKGGDRDANYFFGRLRSGELVGLKTWAKWNE